MCDFKYHASKVNIIHSYIFIIYITYLRHVIVNLFYKVYFSYHSSRFVRRKIEYNNYMIFQHGSKLYMTSIRFVSLSCVYALPKFVNILGFSRNTYMLLMFTIDNSILKTKCRFFSFTRI